MITENGPSYSTRPVATLLLAFLLKGAIIATLFFFCIAVPLKYLVGIDIFDEDPGDMSDWQTAVLIGVYVAGVCVLSSVKVLKGNLRLSLFLLRLVNFVILVWKFRRAIVRAYRNDRKGEK